MEQNQQTGGPSPKESETTVAWPNLNLGTRTSIGLVNGLVAYYISVTFSWNHQSWSLYLLVPLFACLVSSLLLSWTIRLNEYVTPMLISVGAGVLVNVFLGLGLSEPLLMMIITVFSILVAGALILPYVLQGDVPDAAIFNLRILSAVAIIGVVIFVVNDAPSVAARTIWTILFTFGMSVGLLLWQLAITRHVQKLTIGLKQDDLLYQSAGILTFATLLAGFSPLVAGLVLLVSAGVLGIFFLPVLYPIVSLVDRALSHLHRHRQLTQPTQLQNSTRTVQHLSQHGGSTESKWLVWGIVLLILFTVMLVWMLRSRKNALDSEETASNKALGPTQIRRDNQIDSFSLERTNDPIRKQFQSRLMAWHQSGYTIGHSESVRELLKRLPPDEKNQGDEKLSNEYETARYGHKKAHPPDGPLSH